MQATSHEQRSRASSTRPAHDLDSLARLDGKALGRLYAGGLAGGVGRLEGHPTGRMLAFQGLNGGPAFDALRGFAGSRGFPWGGKSFQGAGDAGTGINRVHLFGRHQLFPFHTHVAPSVIDAAPCVVLDYDLPDNPSLIRSIHDEVREVDDGLYLGPAMWKSARGPKLILWFALDTRRQAVSIGTKERA